MWSVIKSTSAALAVLLVISFGTARAENDAAHALAEKFAAANAETKKKDLKAQEAEMLARARKEAEERRLAAAKALAAAEAEEKRQAEAKRVAEEAAKKAEAERQARIAEEQRRQAEATRIAEEAAKKAEAERQARIAEEQRLAEAARLAEEQRRQAEAKRIAEDAAKKAEADRQARIAEEQRLAEAARIAEEQRIAEARRQAEAERAALEAKREEHARQIEEKLRALEMTRAEKATQQAPAQAPAEDEVAERAQDNGTRPISTSPPMSLGAKTTATAKDPKKSGRVAVLLVMDPGTNGIRRFGQKTADPVICSGSECWISTGPANPARAVSRGKALGPGNTLGRRAAACNKSLGCIFRDVDLGTGSSLLQPVDLRVMRHDRRQPLTVSADETCVSGPASLSCSNVFRTKTWRAWIVPEEIAEAAGSAALEAALRKGLDPAREAALKH